MVGRALRSIIYAIIMIIIMIITNINIIIFTVRSDCETALLCS